MNGQNTEKSPGDLRRLAVTQTPVKDPAQKKAIKTNHIKAKIDKTQQNSKCRLCGDIDEFINHIISE